MRGLAVLLILLALGCARETKFLPQPLEGGGYQVPDWTPHTTEDDGLHHVRAWDTKGGEKVLVEWALAPGWTREREEALAAEAARAKTPGERTSAVGHSALQFGQGLQARVWYCEATKRLFLVEAPERLMDKLIDAFDCHSRPQEVAQHWGLPEGDTSPHAENMRSRASRFWQAELAVPLYPGGKVLDVQRSVFRETPGSGGQFYAAVTVTMESTETLEQVAAFYRKRGYTSDFPEPPTYQGVPLYVPDFYLLGTGRTMYAPDPQRPRSEAIGLDRTRTGTDIKIVEWRRVP